VPQERSETNEIVSACTGEIPRRLR